MSGVKGDDREAELSALLRRANRGDERAYAGFLAQAAVVVRMVARRRLGAGPGMDPEDVVQETLMAIHIKRHSWRESEPVTPWLATIARYKIIDAYRRRGSRVDIDIEEMTEILAAPQAETARNEEIERALALLPPGQRAVVERIGVDGRSISETASELQMKEGAVRVALHRGLGAIANRFGLKS
jgi:RNA polymerase sigma-70 factor (ECF subfamily)